MVSLGGDKLLQRFGYCFREPRIFRQALTHKSYINEHPGEGIGHNERMEFLGDAVLDFVITDLLMDNFPALTEGELSKIRASLVSEISLAELARELDLGECLLMGKGEESTGGREKSSILSDSLEAVIAAVYLDSRADAGTGPIYDVLVRLFGPRIERIQVQPRVFDFKTELQELAQKQLQEKVIYRVLGEKGPDHDKSYEVGVYIKDQEYGRGSGHSKKESEQAAAKSALDEHFQTNTAAS